MKKTIILIIILILMISGCNRQTDNDGSDFEYKELDDLELPGGKESGSLEESIPEGISLKSIQLESETIDQIAVSDNGEKIVFRTDMFKDKKSKIYVVDANTGKKTLLYEDTEEKYIGGPPRISGNGEVVIFSLANKDTDYYDGYKKTKELAIIDTNTGELKTTSMNPKEGAVFTGVAHNTYDISYDGKTVILTSSYVLEQDKNIDARRQLIKLNTADPENSQEVLLEADFSEKHYPMNIWFVEDSKVFLLAPNRDFQTIYEEVYDFYLYDLVTDNLEKISDMSLTANQLDGLDAEIHLAPGAEVAYFKIDRKLTKLENEELETIEKYSFPNDFRALCSKGDAAIVFLKEKGTNKATLYLENIGSGKKIPIRVTKEDTEFKLGTKDSFNIVLVNTPYGTKNICSSRGEDYIVAFSSDGIDPETKMSTYNAHALHILTIEK